MKKALSKSSAQKWLMPAALGMGALVAGVIGIQYAPYSLSAVSYLGEATTTPREIIASAGPDALHIKAPEHIRAIYMSQCVAGTPSFRDSLVKFIDNSDLNAVVIDIKDFSGGIAFPTTDPELAPYVSKKCGAADMKAFIASLHAKNIYIIGRITVFQDPMYAAAHPELAVQKAGGGVWKNYGGLAFVDVGAKPFWDHIIKLSNVAYKEIGFDELNYDYIRFPSDGPMKEAVYSLDVGKSKSDALEEFFRYLHAHMQPEGTTAGVNAPFISADLFGYVTVHTDDLGIGQILERALPYFDYIDPMVYPSHYNSGFAGLKNVNSDPYKVVHISLVEAVARTQAATTTVYAFGETPVASTSPQVYEKPVFSASKIRPWLQSFDYPVTYTPAMVKAQIQANEDAGLHGYLFWDAANKYTSLRQTLSNVATN